MSLSAMLYALDQAPSYLTPAERFVLVAIADHVDDDTGQAWPSVARLARRTGQNVRTVQRALRFLEAHRFLTVDRQAAPVSRADKRSNLYRWHPEKALRGRHAVEAIPGLLAAVAPVDNPPSTGRRGVTPTATGRRGDTPTGRRGVTQTLNRPTSTTHLENVTTDGDPTAVVDKPPSTGAGVAAARAVVDAIRAGATS